VKEAKPEAGLALFNFFGAEENDAGREDHGNEGRGEQKVMHGVSP
jgi:hypothetical protein